MNVLDKILGLDTLCAYMGYSTNTGPEYECVPLVALRSKHGSIIPAYTIRKYWDKEHTELHPYQDAGWLDPTGPVQEECVPIMVPFPQRVTVTPRVLETVLRSALLPRNPEINYLDVGNIKEIDKFDFSGLDDMVEHTKSKGILTMVMYDMENICTALADFNRGIVEKFKYCVMRYVQSSRPSLSKQGSLLLHITFLDLGMCTPIFESDKADGIGVICEFIQKTSDNMYLTTERGMSMVLSNKTENIITVDGSIIGIHSTPNSDLIRGLIKIAVSIQQQATKPSNQDDLTNEVDTLATGGVWATSGSYTISSGSTSSTYYTNSTS